MMNKISVVNDITRTTKCLKWCQANLNNNEWNLQLLSMAPLHYTFEFKDPHIHLMAILAH